MKEFEMYFTFPAPTSKFAFHAHFSPWKEPLTAACLKFARRTPPWAAPLHHTIVMQDIYLFPVPHVIVAFLLRQELLLRKKLSMNNWIIKISVSVCLLSIASGRVKKEQLFQQLCLCQLVSWPLGENKCTDPAKYLALLVRNLWTTWLPLIDLFDFGAHLLTMTKKKCLSTHNCDFVIEW